ncbi:efflux RND transporter periplasmic adaptor subunit [bacterium]|nr:efflux RND transporter periplasmic adaptor subunit [bacterium]
MMSNNKLNRTSLLFLLALSLAISACGGASAEAEQPDAADQSNERVVKVNTYELSLSTFEDIIPLTGVLAAPQDASLSAQTAGTVTEIVEVGQAVAQGDVIARLDDRIIRAALDQAKATRASFASSANLAEDLFKRQEPLFRDSIVSAIEFENVRAQVNQAKAALAQADAAVSGAEQQLENTFVRAPFSGTIEMRMAEKGEQVVPGSPIARIVDTSSLKIQAGVPERYAADVRVGSRAIVSFKAYGGDLIASKISMVGNVIDPKSRSFMIELNISNGDRELKPEMIVDVLITRRVLTDQIVLPQTAIIRDENGESVYIVDTSASGPVAKQVSITTGASFGGKTVVTSGLVAGQQVITVGQTMVTDLDRVEITSDAS